MIDLHIHILPGLDDGALDMEDAIEMAEQSWRSGVDAVAATSHATLGEVMDGKWLERYERKLEQLRQKIREEKIGLQVYAGAEILWSERVEESLDIKLLTLNKSRYPLIEFPFESSIEEMEKGLRQILSMRYQPILAHPERYPCIWRQTSALYRWQDLGVIFQVNKGSFRGEFGRRARRTADWILQEQLAGMVASDAHDPCLRTPDLEEVEDFLRWRVGNRGMRLLLEENPRRILENRKVL